MSTSVPNDWRARSESEWTAATTSGQPLEERKIIINYLPSYFTSFDLHFLLKNHVGYIRSNVVMEHGIRNVTTKGYGFAEYSSSEKARVACDKITGVRLSGKTLKASPARPQSEEIKNTNLYIRAVPKSWTKLDLLKYFLRFGRVISHQVVRDHATGQPDGTAFVRYDTTAQANCALAFHANIPHGLQISRTLQREVVEQKKAQKVRESFVFVKDIFSHTEKTLCDYFEQAFKHKVVSCRIVNGMAYVRFESPRVANAVVCLSELLPEALPVQKLF